MKKITINKINEDIYYHKLDNGLDVYFYVNKNMHNNSVTFTTRYGSIYNEFVDSNGKVKKFPNGIAHFLEHKVFVQKESQPVSGDPQGLLYGRGNTIYGIGGKSGRVQGVYLVQYLVSGTALLRPVLEGP